MATTWIKSVGTGAKSTSKSALKRIIDYVMDKEKTQDGLYITTNDCRADKAVDEFLIKKQLYHQITGRKQPSKRDVVCYHVRQSFSPDEVLTPEQVNELGRQLAMKITGGNNQFIVCTHVNEKHLHNHIIFNAVDTDCSKKFANEFQSSFKVRAMSDEICLMNGLSVVENPTEKENSVSRDVWEDKKKGIDWKQILQHDIETVVKESKDIADFKKRLKSLGYELKGKQRLSVKHPNRSNFMRTDRISSKFDYSIKGIEFAIKHGHFLPKAKELDLQKNKSVREFLSLDNKSGGFAHYAKVQNIKDYVKTQNFLEKHGLTDYKDLAFEVDEKAEQVEFLRSKIKQLESDIDKSNALKTHIANFAKTKKIYDAYKSTRYKDEFYNEHSSEILLHEASKQAFSNLSIKKLPKVADLKNNISVMMEQKQSLYAEYKKANAELKELRTVKNNVDNSLAQPVSEKEKER